jgi:hypothetical protein
MTATVRIVRVVSPVAGDVWESVYSSCAGAMPTQSPRWASAVAAAGGYRNVSRLYEFSDGRRAVLPLFAGRLLAAQYSPPAAWGFGGLLADQGFSSAHLRAVLDDLSRTSAPMMQIRPNPLDAAIWKVAAPPDWTALPRTAHVLDLRGGFETVWSKQFRGDARTMIRRAERAGLEVVSGSGTELIAEFHHLLRLSFERWARRQNEPPFLARWRGQWRDPAGKFHAIAAALGPAFRIWLARLEGRPVAAILVLRDREAHYTRGAMDEQLAGKTHANYLLHSKAIEEACRAGCTAYHMGETGASASLAQFKTRFGAAPHPYAEYRFERLPLWRLKDGAKTLVKRLIDFRDA